MKKLFIALFILSLFPLSALAVEDTQVSDLLSQSEVKAAEIQELDQKEIERQKEFENQLGFTLPEYTDNPSYVITFKDPSPQQSGVQVEIDAKEYIDITSPYTLPALSIGEHTLKFRFNDKDGNVQLLEYSLIVISRSPIINTPVSDESSITLGGTGLSNSDIIVFLTSNTFNHNETVQTDENGDWSLVVTPEDGLANGIYTVTAYTRRYGYASELTQPVVFEVGTSNTTNVQDEKQPIAFAFNSLNKDNFQSIAVNNPDLIVLIVSSFILGIFLALILRGILKSKREDSVLKKAEGLIKSNTSQNNSKEKTLRELFEGRNEEAKAQPLKPIEKKEEVHKNEIKKTTEKVISKEDFLKDFKSVDPDDNAGKEKEVKREIKVSLTSREE